jgi:hypothetical protein
LPTRQAFWINFPKTFCLTAFFVGFKADKNLIFSNFVGLKDDKNLIFRILSALRPTK